MNPIHQVVIPKKELVETKYHWMQLLNGFVGQMDKFYGNPDKLTEGEDDIYQYISLKCQIAQVEGILSLIDKLLHEEKVDPKRFGLKEIKIG